LYFISLGLSKTTRPGLQNARDATPDGSTLRFETGLVVVKETECKPRREARPGEYVGVTRFDVYFPAYHMGPLVKEAKAKQQSLPVGTETILLAEDESDVREFAQRVLEGLGHRVLVAEDGATAVDASSANQQEIGLVVLDVVMPKVSGPKAYEAMSMVREGVPVIYISGYSESMAGMARQDAREQMLLKPFTVEELGRRVRQTLDETRKHGRLRTPH